MSDVLIFPDSDAPTRWELPWGEVVAFSRCSPEREPNEDRAAVVSTPHGALLLAIDGMGGQSAGHVASRLTLERVLERVQHAEPTKSALRHAVLDGIEAANRAVMDMGMGAGATLAAILVHEVHARTVHVGDAYALHVGQRGRVKSQTVSHSPTGYGVEAGLLDEAEAMVHEERHLVLNYVGHAGLRIEVGPSLTCAARDTLLVASDGLTDNLTQDEIISLARKGPLIDGAEALSRTATERMRSPRPDRPSKPDDLTFVLCRPTRSTATAETS